jgi:predicted nucleic acid-binding protein
MGKRYLIDSNTLIEFTGRLLPASIHSELSSIIDTDFNISFINKIEVLAHHTADIAWQNFIEQANIIKADDDIISQTIQIRKIQKIKIPDALVAATALVNDLILLTRNVNDFKNIPGLQVENPWTWENINQ